MSVKWKGKPKKVFKNLFRFENKKHFKIRKKKQKIAKALIHHITRE